MANIIAANSLIKLNNSLIFLLLEQHAIKHGSPTAFTPTVAAANFNHYRYIFIFIFES